jgi:hypothetical protein
MPEPEVSLRLAINLIESGHTDQEVVVSLDGAHLKTGSTVHFDLVEFLAALGWHRAEGESKWQTKYRRNQQEPSIRINSQSGCGDVVASLKNGRTFLAECKKGPLARSKSSEEYPLMREALGQLLTLESVAANPVLAIAVPHGERFIELAARWRKAPLVQRAEINILTVCQGGKVYGWA